MKKGAGWVFSYIPLLLEYAEWWLIPCTNEARSFYLISERVYFLQNDNDNGNEV